MPGGSTYGTGKRDPFSSKFTTDISNCVVPLLMSKSFKSFKYLRHSPLTKSNDANLHTMLSLNPLKNVLINLIDLKS